MKKKKINNMEKVRSAKKPVLVHSSKNYKIYKIPLNYMIIFSPLLRFKKPYVKEIDKDCYSNSDNGLEKAIDLAKYLLNEYFVY